MSALVSYESSSDDDDQPSRQEHELATGAKVNNITAESNGQIGTFEAKSASSLLAEPPKNGEDKVRPMVGPMMPDQIENQVEPELSLEIHQSMSERDAVRFLTQASDPITSIPPSPPGTPDPALDAKFKRFLDLKAKGVHFNDDLASKSTFRNPSLLATMMARAGVDGDDQYKTSIPKQIWDPLDFPISAYKEELLRSQQNLREQDFALKKSLSASGKRTIEFTSGGTSRSNSRDSTPGLPVKRKRP